MEKFKCALFITLIVVLLVSINVTVILVNGKGYVDYRQYYTVDCTKLTDTKSADVESLMRDFALEEADKDLIKYTLLTATQGSAVLMVGTNEDIKTFGEDLRNRLLDSYSSANYSVASSDVTYKDLHMKQLWRITGDGVRVTAYEITDEFSVAKYLLSIRLPIDKLEFAKKNGTMVEGFPKGKATV